MATNLYNAAQLLDVRTAAHNVLQGISKTANTKKNSVEFAGAETPFHAARLLAFQSYLSSTWAVCDIAPGVAGKLLCTGSAAANPKRPPQLWPHFFQNTTQWSHQAGSLMKNTFGWPVAISYIIRNHFMHDGALHPANGTSFFEGEAVRDRYNISDAGKGHIEEFATRAKAKSQNGGEKKQNGCGVDGSMTRLPNNPLNAEGLLDLLDSSNRSRR